MTTLANQIVLIWLCFNLIYSLLYGWIHSQWSHRVCGLIRDFSVYIWCDAIHISADSPPFLSSFSGPASVNPFMVRCQTAWFWKDCAVFHKIWQHSKVLIKGYRNTTSHRNIFYFIYAVSVLLVFLKKKLSRGDLALNSYINSNGKVIRWSSANLRYVENKKNIGYSCELEHHAPTAYAMKTPFTDMPPSFKEWINWLHGKRSVQHVPAWKK